jgi:hypothetical protein
MKVRVLTHHSLRPVQIDVFGSDVERSIKGAIYFWPNSVKEITDGELEYIKEKHPWLAAKLTLVKVEEVKAKEPKVVEPEKFEESEKATRRSRRISRRKSDAEDED